MKIDELKKIFESGKSVIVKMNEKIYDFVEDSFDTNMIGKLIGINKEDDFYCLTIDMNGYEKHNRSVAVHDWHDKEGKRVLCWLDTKFYPSNGIETIYVTNSELPFHVENYNFLFDNYLKSNHKGSYTDFLENLIMEMREQAAEERNNY